MKIILTLLIVIVLAGQSNAQLSKKQQAVQGAVINLFHALSNRDSVALKTYSAADITLYEYGQMWNRDSLILKAITQNQSADFKRTNRFEFINTTVDKNMAWATYRLQSIIIKDGKQLTVQWLETAVLVKERKPAYRKGRQWKVKHLHSTLIKRS